jgi:tRNA uridine 5-carboxymethylaminomethyl modification enzyme
VFGRHEAYIGVLIDDLVTQGVTEPYRMFTSRAEFRLTLRADNADQRLTGRGVGLGCVGSGRAALFRAKAETLDRVRRRASELRLTPNEAAAIGLRVKADGHRRSLLELLAFPEVDFRALAAIWPEIGAWPDFAREQIRIDAAYSGYLRRQDADIASFRNEEQLVIPVELNYAELSGLSNEAREKLQMIRPATLGQAARIEGVTPGTLSLLLGHVRRLGRRAA